MKAQLGISVVNHNLLHSSTCRVSIACPTTSGLPSCPTIIMEDNNVPQTMNDLLQVLAQQQTIFQAQLQEQINANTARMEALASKPPAVRKAEPPPPMYNGSFDEGLELWIFLH